MLFMPITKATNIIYIKNISNHWFKSLHSLCSFIISFTFQNPSNSLWRLFTKVGKKSPSRANNWIGKQNNSPVLFFIRNCYLICQKRIYNHCHWNVSTLNRLLKVIDVKHWSLTSLAKTIRFPCIFCEQIILLRCPSIATTAEACPLDGIREKKNRQLKSS